MLDWSTIDTVLLDMDGTLLDLHFDNYFWLEFLPEKYAQHRGITIDGARLILEEMSSALEDSLNWYSVDYWSDVLEINIQSLKEEVSHLICFRPNAVEFIEHVKALNKQVIIITNAHPKALALKSEKTGLHNHVQRIISSHDLELAKENLGFWSNFATRENLELSKCLLIEDSHKVLTCAEKEGVTQLIQILQPDSKKLSVPSERYPGIINFSEIITS